MEQLYVRGLAKKRNSKNPILLWKWVAGSRSHSEFLFFGKSSQNSPKPVLINYFVVYHVYSVCIYIAKSCWLLWFECSVHVSDGFPKNKFGRGRMGVVSSIQVFGIFGICLTLQSPLLSAASNASVCWNYYVPHPTHPDWSSSPQGGATERCKRLEWRPLLD